MSKQIGRALTRERRRAVAERDALILAAAGDDLGMQRFAQHMAGAPLGLE